MKVIDVDGLKSKFKEIAVDTGRVTLTDAFRVIDELSEELKEIKAPIPEGELIISINEGIATQATIGFNSEETGYIDLMMAECKGPDLAREDGSCVEDINMFVWGDMFDEDYTYKTCIPKDNIEHIKELSKEFNDEDEPEI